MTIATWSRISESIYQPYKDLKAELDFRQQPEEIKLERPSGQTLKAKRFRLKVSAQKQCGFFFFFLGD